MDLHVLFPDNRLLYSNPKQQFSADSVEKLGNNEDYISAESLNIINFA